MNLRIVHVFFSLLFLISFIKAGPPYDTDDPEPVELHHWEFYVSSHSTHDDNGWSGTLPHVEVNYGAIKNLQLHIIAPFSYNFPDGGSKTYGYGDMELGIKLRFVQEGGTMPMIGIFPLAELPTGDEKRGLGNGKAQFYLPLWIQKSFGNWQTYGGAGYWINPGADKKNWLYFGWLIQRQVSQKLSIGTELYHTTPSDVNGGHETRFNIGMVFDFTDNHHLLFSIGRGLQGPVKTQLYLGYQLTLGLQD